MLIRKSAPAFCRLLGWHYLLCISLFLSPLESRGAELELDRIKIAFVYKFLSLVEWPEEAGDTSTSKTDIVIGVAGRRSLVKGFSVLADRIVRERKISIRAIELRERDTRPVSVLYFENSFLNRSGQILANYAEDAVLTIAEGERTKLADYIILLYEQDGFIRFDINNTLARSKGIQLNAKLLELAGRVI